MFVLGSLEQLLQGTQKPSFQGTQELPLQEALELPLATQELPLQGMHQLPLQGMQKQEAQEQPLQGMHQLPLQGMQKQEAQEQPLQVPQKQPLQASQKQPLQESQELPLQGAQNDNTKLPYLQSGLLETRSSSQIDHSVHQHRELPTLLVTNLSNSESANLEADGAPEVSVLESSQSSSAETNSSPISSIGISNQQRSMIINSKASGDFSSASMHIDKLPNSKLPVEIRRSPSLEAPELVISVSPGIKTLKLPVVEVAAKLPVVNNPVKIMELTSESENDQSSESIPVFVSQAPTGLTSPVALRPNIEGSSKRDLLFEDQAIKVKENKTKKLNTNNVTGDKNNFIATPCHKSKKRKQRQPVDTEFSLSIAERTRSRAKGGGQSASSFLRKSAKRESRELNRLVVDMNGYDLPKNKRERKSLNKFRKGNVKKCRSNIDGAGMCTCLR